VDNQNENLVEKNTADGMDDNNHQSAPQQTTQAENSGISNAQNQTEMPPANTDEISPSANDSLARLDSNQTQNVIINSAGQTQQQVLKNPKNNRKLIFIILAFILIISLILGVAAFFSTRINSNNRNSSYQTSNMITATNQIVVGPTGIESTTLDTPINSEVIFVNRTEKEVELVDKSGSIRIVIPANTEYNFPINFTEGTTISLSDKNNPNSILKISVKANK
jgi:hypothetical protein